MIRHLFLHPRLTRREFAILGGAAAAGLLLVLCFGPGRALFTPDLSHGVWKMLGGFFAHTLISAALRRAAHIGPQAVAWAFPVIAGALPLHLYGSHAHALLPWGFVAAIVLSLVGLAVHPGRSGASAQKALVL